jgi:cellulose synthase/poly-beta-1,6-N-acetylglucosamine synthase-like glycosyltransferase
MTFWEWILSYLKQSLGLNLIEANPLNYQGWFNLVFSCLSLFIGILVAYRTLYAVLGFFGHSRLYPTHAQDKRYAFVLCARNEEKVIGNLIESIRGENYPQELIDIYVIADNCSDETATVAKSLGCFVYERHDLQHCRKGFALRDFFADFKKSHDVLSYYGFCFMDSDNVVAPSFLSKMNDALQEGYDVVSGYRNVKNLAENWVTAIGGINMYRSVIFSHRPRSILNSAEMICGTGFIMRSPLLEEGWVCTGLTEDSETMIRLVGQEKKMGYCEEAEFYDEQPSTVKIALRQRLRWQKGMLLNWWEHGWGLFLSFLKHPTWSKYDLYWEIFPYGLVALLFGVLQQLFSVIYLLVSGGQTGYSLMDFFMYPVNTLFYLYLGGFFTGIIIYLKEWKKMHFNPLEAFLYLFLWPIYDMLGGPISVVCLFVKVSWKPIPHHVVEDPHVLVAEEEARAKKNRVSRP